MTRRAYRAPSEYVTPAAEFDSVKRLEHVLMGVTAAEGKLTFAMPS